MANPNITRVYLLDTPLEGDYENTLYFDSKEAQREYMLSKVKHSFTDFSYQRKDGFIRVPMHIDKLYDCNYVMYQNTAYSNKWFYAFITDMVYVSGNEDGTDGRTDIYIQADVIQTWLLDYEVLPSFVEREHTASDEIGEHTYPEGLETGEYVCSGKRDVGPTKSGGDGMVIASTINLAEKINIDLFDKYDTVRGGLYNGVFSGLNYYYVGRSNDSINISTLLKEIDKEGQGEGIHSIFMSPVGYLDLKRFDDGTTSIKVNEYYISIINNTSTPKILKPENLRIERPVLIGGHKVRNNKLFTNPYCYLLVSNNSGLANIYEYELFDEGVADFKIISAVTPGMSVRIIPVNYKGLEENNEEGLNLGKFPICAWSTDTYTNWLTQQGMNIGLEIGSGIAQIGGALVAAYGTAGAAAPLSGAMMASGISQIANAVSSVYSHSKIPPMAKGNINSGDVSYAYDLTRFSYYQMSIKKEYAEIIDNYFDMYGYKICKVKQPEVAKRANWWYTKTLNVNIDGAIPGKDMQIIKDCYNRGIRFWRNPSKVGDYSLDNTIVSG